MTSRNRLTGVIACAFLSWPGLVAADAVTDWNEVAAASVAAGRPGPIGQVDLALVQAAVHDAVQALDRRYEPYYAEVPGAGGSRTAAVAAVTHDLLVAFYPSQAATLDPAYFTYLADKGLTGNPGLAVGQAVAAAYVSLRRLNPNPLPAPFTGGTGIGEWRPTPPALAAMATPWLGAFDPFTMTGPARFRAPLPPSLTSARYTADYNEVKKLGALTSTDRTAAQTDVAYFWTDNFAVQWNRALRAIASQHIHKTGDTARLFALANLATADALITSWDSKKYFNFWRPLTAIREGDNDGNPNTVGDPAWQSLISNPPYPDYTSGANNVTGAMTGTLAYFFNRDKMTFDVTSNAANVVQKTRTYNRFSEAAQEVVDARVLLGIHFRFADTEARTQGRRVAKYAFNHYLLPVHGNKNDHKDDDDKHDDDD